MRRFWQGLLLLGLVAFVPPASGCGDENANTSKKTKDSADDDDDDDDDDDSSSDDDDSSGDDPPTDDGGSTVKPCSGSCAENKMTVTTPKGTATLVRAQYGSSPLEGGEPGIRVEVHLGGAPECPDEDSPQTDYTLVLSGVPAKAALAAGESPKIVGAFFDFTTNGKLLDEPLAKITSATVTNFVGDPTLAVPFYAFDIDVTLAGGGTVKGHVYAHEHCASLDD